MNLYKTRGATRRNAVGRAAVALLLFAFILLATPPLYAQGEPQLGSEFIGELEGPTTVTDPAQFPTALNEAPILTERVDAGDLPPVEDRLPVREDLLVIQPVHEIGQYGGTIRRAFTGPNDHWNGKRVAARDTVLYFDPTMQEVVPNVAKSIEVSEDGRVFTLTLRRGMKWSDGEPFTADDFTFWYADIYQNEELGAPAPVFSINGKAGTLEKVDDHTVRYTFPEPYYLFPEILAGFNSISSHATWGFSPGGGGFAPAHYLRQFHPGYVAEDELDRMAKDAGFANWVEFFLSKNDWSLNPDLPVLTPWKTREPANTQTWVLERNPYYFGVDAEGNQLPYVDEIVMTLVEDLEALNLQAVAGEYDFQARHIDLQKLPLFLQNQERGDYKVYLDPGDFGANAMIAFNMNFAADEELAGWFNTPDFRHALSLGIDRDQINETFFLGIGTPGSVVPRENNLYFPGEEYRALWATHDVEQANELLDAIGLNEKDAQGFRLRSDGQGRLRLRITAVVDAFIPATGIAEMVREHWREIGIDAAIQQVDGSLAITQHEANETQLQIWDNGGTDRIFSGAPNNLFPADSASYMGPLYGAWFASGGAEGEEPPQPMLGMMEAWRRAFGVPDEERAELGKQIWRTQAEEVYQIGLVGLAPAVMGVRLAKNDLGNVPSRQVNTTDAMTPGISRPETFFWRGGVDQAGQ